MADRLDPNEIVQALEAWARTNPHGYGTGGGPDAFDYIQFHSRPDPRGPDLQVTFRAELVNGRPAIRVSKFPPSADDAPTASEHAESRRTILTGTGGPLREPTASCESCEATGTVGRAVRTDGAGGVLEVHRFCLACWPEQAARYRARWEEEDRQAADGFLRDETEPSAGRGMAFGAATWHLPLQLVRDLQQMMNPPVPPTPGDLEHLANDISERAVELDGPMPFEIEAFIRQYGSASTERGSEG
jgi:hypothetical protein